jgi:hypothetical protein
MSECGDQFERQPFHRLEEKIFSGTKKGELATTPTPHENWPLNWALLFAQRL